MRLSEDGCDCLVFRLFGVGSEGNHKRANILFGGSPVLTQTHISLVGRINR